jgi:hypothetical protein
MKLITHDIPDRTEVLAYWLERELVGLRLRDLAVELVAFQGITEDHPTLDELLGDELSDVLASGLSVLPEHQLRELLKHPTLLLDLQERILLEGGPYWTEEVVVSDVQADTVRMGWKTLQPKLATNTRSDAKTSTTGETTPAPISTVAPSAKSDHSKKTVSVQPAVQPKQRSFAKAGLTMLVMAAIAVGITVFLQMPSGPQWGLDRPGLVASNKPTAELYQSIAGAVEQDWTPARTADKTALVASLTDFRHGCDTLINAPLTQLPEKDRTWIKERCQKWREKIVGHLADLEAGQKPFDTVRDEANATVNKLITVLRDESAKV